MFKMKIHQIINTICFIYSPGELGPILANKFENISNATESQNNDGCNVYLRISFDIPGLAHNNISDVAAAPAFTVTALMYKCAHTRMPNKNHLIPESRFLGNQRIRSARDYLAHTSKRAARRAARSAWYILVFACELGARRKQRLYS